MTIKRSLTARRRDFLGVFDIAATNKPAKITFTYAIAAKLSNHDGELPELRPASSAK